MNIDGIRVLSQEAIMESPDFVWIIAGLLVTGFIVFAIVSVVLINCDWTTTLFVISGSLAFLWVIIAGICGIFDRPSNRYVYMCIFNEDVSIQEVYDNYEIADRYGDIWILEDKEKIE